MLQMMWDSLAPLILISLGLFLTRLIREPDRAHRIWLVLRTFLPQIQAAWNGALYSPPHFYLSGIHNSSSDQSESPTLDIHKTVYKTPDMITTLDKIQDLTLSKRYVFPYGWSIDDENTSLRLEFTTLNDPTHMAIIGPQHHGKTSLVLSGLISLTDQHTPQEINFVILAPESTELDLEISPYIPMLVHSPELVASAIDDIYREIEYRKSIFLSKEITLWDEYEGNDLPLVVVYIADLFKLRQAVDNVTIDQLLAFLMDQGSQLGFRVIIESYSLAYIIEPWNDLITHYILGPSLEDIEKEYFATYLDDMVINPKNTTLPSKLSRNTVGVFTILGAEADSVTIYATYFPDKHHRIYLDYLSGKQDIAKVNDVLFECTSTA